MFSALILKYACSGMSMLTPGGTCTNEPPDRGAAQRENLLSSADRMVPACSARCPCSRSRESSARDDLGPFSHSSFKSGGRPRLVLAR